MPGSPKNTEFVSGKRDTATNFNAEYAKKGIQPTSANDPSYHQPKPDQNIRAVKTTHYQNPRIVSRKNYSKINLPGGGNSLAKAAFTRGKVTTVNASILAGGISAWMMFQLPFAILSIILFGVTGFVESLTISTNAKADDRGLVSSMIEGVGEVLVTVLSFVAENVLKLVGIDIDILNPSHLFLLSNSIVFFFGLAMLLVIYFIYKIAFLNPLSGKAGGMKMGALLLCLIGYWFPVANLFPWFIVWTVVVWLHPK